MEKEFVPHGLALRLKALGFDEPCFAGYNFKDGRTGEFTYPSARDSNTTSEARVYHRDKKIIGAPTFSQAFRWFRKTYPNVIFEVRQSSWKEVYSKFFDFKVHIEDKNKTIGAGGFVSYEEAELPCLCELLDIVENK